MLINYNMLDAGDFPIKFIHCFGSGLPYSLTNFVNILLGSQCGSFKPASLQWRSTTSNIRGKPKVLTNP